MDINVDLALIHGLSLKLVKSKAFFVVCCWACILLVIDIPLVCYVNQHVILGIPLVYYIEQHVILYVLHSIFHNMLIFIIVD